MSTREGATMKQITYFVLRVSGNDTQVVGESFLTVEAAEGFQDWCYANRPDGDDADFEIDSRVVYKVTRATTTTHHGG
jgi:hypothetical protein